jgi:hypothetical protein
LSLKLNEVVNPDGRGVFDTIRGLFGSEPKAIDSTSRRGGIVDPKGIERIITRSIPFDSATTLSSAFCILRTDEAIRCLQGIDISAVVPAIPFPLKSRYR